MREENEELIVSGDIFVARELLPESFPDPSSRRNYLRCYISAFDERSANTGGPKFPTEDDNFLASAFKIYTERMIGIGPGKFAIEVRPWERGIFRRTAMAEELLCC